MDFRLSEEQEAFRDSVRAFAREHVEPGVLERDRAGTWDWDVWKQVAGFGLAGLPGLRASLRA